MLNEKFVFVTNDINGNSLFDCNFTKLPGTVGTQPLGYAWTKNLPHGDFFSYFLRNFKEIGILNKIISEFMEEERSDCLTSTFSSTGLTNIISAFVILFGAAVGALALCIGECLLKRWVGWEDNHEDC